MNPTASDRRNTDSENIDLLILAERSFQFFRRYRWIFLSAIILGLLTGYFFYRVIPKSYESRLVLHSYILTNPEQIQIVKGWNERLGKNDHQSLAKEWNVDPKSLGPVKWIRAREIQQVFTEDNPNGFMIDALVTDTSVLDELQAGIVHGFENNAYISERLAMRREGLKELIEKTRTEVQKLDSTKRQMQSLIGGTARIGTPVLIDASTVNRQWVEMNEKLINLEETLVFTRSVQVLQNFSKFAKPDNPKLLPWLIMGLLGFLIIAYIIALLISIKRGLDARARR